MTIESNKERILISERAGEFRKEQKVECKTSIPTDSVKKMIFVTAYPYLLRQESTENSVNYSGKVSFFICYEDQDGELRKCECEKEFNGEILDLVLPERVDLRITPTVEKTEADLSGVHLAVNCQLLTEVQIKTRLEREYLVGGENLICDLKEEEITVSLGQRNTNYTVEEEYEVNYSIAEVLYQSADCVITDSQCGVGCIIVDGQVNLSQILLQSGEKRDIIKESRSVPFRAEIDCEEAMPALTSSAYCLVKSFKTDITVDGEQGKSQIQWRVNLSLFGEGYKQEQIIRVCDAFSLDSEIELESQNLLSQTEKNYPNVEEKLVQKTNIEELPVGAIYSCVLGERAFITSQETVENGISVTGVCQGTAIFLGGEGKVFSRKLEAPFMSLLKVETEELDKVSVSVCAKNMGLKVISLDGGEITCELCFSPSIVKTEEVKLVKEAVKVKEKERENSAISVYIPQKEEGLFPLAKRLNVHPNELLLTNKEIQFPLTGEERIVVFRQK
ncbi:MAG: DUF3794 domain-containing protein [Clostridia bacterium]|nr:DUF3794 domain-containing protein [Clostridia bacterium]